MANVIPFALTKQMMKKPLIAPSLLSADFLNLNAEVERMNESEAENYIEQTAKAGAMLMCVHQEACVHLHRTVAKIHETGMKAGVALNPSTPVSVLEDIINDVDLVLLMSVNPGFGGQKFIENTLNKVKRLRQLIDSAGSKALIEVDGGVQAQTAPLLIEAGADVLVAGNYVFKSANPKETIHQLKSL